MMIPPPATRTREMACVCMLDAGLGARIAARTVGEHRQAGVGGDNREQEGCCSGVRAMWCSFKQ